VPIQELTRSGAVPAGPTADDAVIGVWSTTSRRSTRVINPAQTVNEGPWRQISRLGNPLVNEVVIPLKLKDAFNSLEPTGDAIAVPYVLDPELARLMQLVFGINIPPSPAKRSCTDLRARYSRERDHRTELLRTVNRRDRRAARVPSAECCDPAKFESESTRSSRGDPAGFPNGTPFRRRRGRYRVEGGGWRNTVHTRDQRCSEQYFGRRGKPERRSVSNPLSVSGCAESRKHSKKRKFPGTVVCFTKLAGAAQARRDDFFGEEKKICSDQHSRSHLS
jgi:hypothetical protein